MSQWWEDRDEQVIEDTIRSFRGLTPEGRIDWCAFICAAVWLAAMAVIAVAVLGDCVAHWGA